ncbi:hypothetical protein FJV46_04225 [Arthrobacter agilis]|uniref:hypothetical protein n=1 Tax=Arthrobacter agilis TaxID=37921 RepID=UPI000B34C6A8|nr:hypothetical protein [Arthrobacter agilis]OUM41390.1 hypothetical protein B8W74_10815 [Arthrobacter agilis]PPB46278.1 hypothetical protein CI784_08075 [Arthrobacter agilis]TPV27035.1 hypothetical protein FJV46_04225 [Arthrobacter agilis]VDR32817.1 Uncharacterised protein [Arthrobacter agilis]
MSYTESGYSTYFTVDTSEVLLVALYLRDSAGLRGAGRPALPPLIPAVRRVETRRLTEPVGGQAALRVEWEAWWHELLRHRVYDAVLPAPPLFEALNGMESLKALLRAHFGAAMAWAQERCAEYALHAGSRGAESMEYLLARIIQERELELGRASRRFTLQVVELPLGVRRAWWVEPETLLMCQELFDDERSFRSYVEPVVRMLA